MRWEVGYHEVLSVIDPRRGYHTLLLDDASGSQVTPHHLPCSLTVISSSFRAAEGGSWGLREAMWRGLMGASGG